MLISTPQERLKLSQVISTLLWAYFKKRLHLLARIKDNTISIRNTILYSTWDAHTSLRSLKWISIPTTPNSYSTPAHYTPSWFKAIAHLNLHRISYLWPASNSLDNNGTTPMYGLLMSGSSIQYLVKINNLRLHKNGLTQSTVDGRNTEQCLKNMIRIKWGREVRADSIQCKRDLDGPMDWLWSSWLAMVYL